MFKAYWYLEMWFNPEYILFWKTSEVHIHNVFNSASKFLKINEIIQSNLDWVQQDKGWESADQQLIILFSNAYM